MRRVFVSGCYDIIHAGHIQFFKEARSLGDHLTVCFASDEVLWEHKNRKTSLPQDHKRAILSTLDCVDAVVIGTCDEMGLDFKDHFLEIKPDVLAVTEDDQYEGVKRALCEQVGAEYLKLPKTPPEFTPVSTTSIVQNIKTPTQAPLRVDFAGGWLDVPRYARNGAYVVNCAVSPTVSLREWNYEQRSGLGGSGAWALLNGVDAVKSELDLGVGWQDPAIIRETGVCVWRSGPAPVLEFKRNGDFLAGKMALYYTGKHHDTPDYADSARDYDIIEKASKLAKEGVLTASIQLISDAVTLSYQAQIKEGMDTLPDCDYALAKKYCGGGWGGYSLYIFDSTENRDRFVTENAPARAIEPYTILS